MNNTKIEWCNSTWNPVTGCLHGCEYCYARKIANRFGGWKYTPGMIATNTAEDKTYIAPIKKYYGEAKETERGKIAEIEYPFLKENNSKSPYPFGFDPTFHKYRLDEPQKWVKPRTIFVGSMTDLFGEWVPDRWIKDVFAACEKAPQHRYLFLTKNPARYLKLVKQGKLSLLNANPNMWFGTSLTQITDVKRILDTFQIINCGINTFISIEPLLGAISPYENWNDLIYNKYVDWVIIGAETGNRKDKIVPSKIWINDIVEDCEYNKIPVFMKNSLVPIIGEENMRRDFPWEA